MPNLGVVLKEEIRRLARKEIKPEITAMRKLVAKQRREIAGLKRDLTAQVRRVASLERATKTTAPAAPEGEVAEMRFSPKWLRSHRAKLEISAADYAALVGVSMLTIYNWEKGKTKPRAQQLGAWGAVRGLTKREAWERLEKMGR
jgi:DNA-binding transcriptional regulator YiaG